MPIGLTHSPSANPYGIRSLLVYPQRDLQRRNSRMLAAHSGLDGYQVLLTEFNFATAEDRRDAIPFRAHAHCRDARVHRSVREQSGCEKPVCPSHIAPQYQGAKVPVRPRHDRAERELLKVAQENQKTNSSFVGGVARLGLVASGWGFWRWRYRVQTRDDAIANLQLRKLRAEVDSLEAKSSAQTPQAPAQHAPAESTAEP